MLRDNKLRSVNTDPCLPMLSEGAAIRSDLPIMGIFYLQSAEYRVRASGECGESPMEYTSENIREVQDG